MNFCDECRENNKTSEKLNSAWAKLSPKAKWYILSGGAVLFLFTLSLVADLNKDPRIFSNAQVCKAAIAITMGKPISIVKHHRSSSEGVHFLSYNHDGSNWTYRCKIEGNRVIWSTPSGRWRTHHYDGIIRFYENDNTLTVIESYNDGSSRKKNFSINEL